MALSASTVWEFASGGSMNNGGGYVTTGGSTNYSLAAPTPALALTDCYHGAGSTTLTSDTGGFTTAMIGNLLKVVSGTNFTVGWFEIKTRVNSYNITVDRSLGASANTNKDGVVNVGGALAYGIAAQDTAFHAAVVASNTIWYSGGNTSPGTTFTTAGNIAAGTNGGSNTPISYKGYKLTRGDDCTGLYRPTIACGAYTLQAGQFQIWANLNLTGTSGYLLFTGAYNTVVNCKAVNTSASANQSCFAITSTQVTQYIGCEASCPNGYGFNIGGITCGYIGCYAHDCAIGFYSSTFEGQKCFGCIAETCNTGISVFNRAMVVNCTVRNCKTGIGGINDGGCAFVNNIITDCFVGAGWTISTLSNFWAYNCFYGNTTPRTNVTAGATDIATDPALTGVCGKGTDGASEATTKVFTSASAPFADVTTSDYLAIFAGTGTGIKLGVYAISSVASIPGQVTLATDPTDASNNISSCTFGVVKGSDFTLGATSSCIDAALDAQTYSGVTV